MPNGRDVKIDASIDVGVKHIDQLKAAEEQAKKTASALEAVQKAAESVNTTLSSKNVVGDDKPSRYANGQFGSSDPVIAGKRHRLDDAAKLLDLKVGRLTPDQFAEYARKQIDGTRRHYENLGGAIRLNQIAETALKASTGAKVTDARSAVDNAVRANYLKGGRQDLDMLLTHLGGRSTDPSLSPAQQMRYAIEAAKEINRSMQEAAKSAGNIRKAQFSELESQITRGMSPGAYGNRVGRMRGLIGEAENEAEQRQLQARLNRVQNQWQSWKQTTQEKADSKAQREAIRTDLENKRQDTEATSLKVQRSALTAETAYMSGGKQDPVSYAQALRTAAQDPNLSARERFRYVSRAERLESQMKASAKSSESDYNTDQTRAFFVSRENGLRRQLAQHRGADPGGEDYLRTKEELRSHYQTWANNSTLKFSATEQQQLLEKMRRMDDSEFNQLSGVGGRKLSHLHRTGQIGDDEYRQLLIGRLNTVKQYSTEWERTWNQITRLDRDMVAKHFQGPGGTINPNHSPFLTLAEHFMGRDAKVGAMRNIGMAMTNAGASWQSLGIGLSPADLIQRGIADFAQIEEARLRGDTVLKNNASAMVASGRMTKGQYDQEVANTAKLNKQIRTAAVETLPIKDGAVSLNVFKEELAKADVRAGDMMKPIEAMARFNRLVNDMKPNELAEETVKTINSMQNVILRDAQKRNPSLSGVDNVFDDRIGAIPQYLAKIRMAASRTGGTEQDIFRLTRRIAGTGGTIGMSEDQIIAFSASLANVGVKPEMGGTAISQYMQMLNSGVKSYDARTGKYNKQLGLVSRAMYGGKSDTQINAGAKEFVDLFNKDAGEAVLRFTDRLQELQKAGEDVPALLDRMGIGGARMTDTLTRLGNAIQPFHDTVKGLTDVGDAMGYLRKETDPLLNSTQGKLDQFQNRLKEVGAMFVESFGGEINKALEIFKQFVDVLAWGINMFEKLPQPIRDGVVQLTAFVFMLRGLAAVFGPVVMGAANVGGALVAWQKLGFINGVLIPMRTALTGVAVANETVASTATAAGVSTGAMAGKMALSLGVLSALAAAAAYAAQSIQAVTDAEVEYNKQQIEILGDPRRRANEIIRGTEADATWAKRVQESANKPPAAGGFGSQHLYQDGLNKDFDQLSQKIHKTGELEKLRKSGASNAQIAGWLVKETQGRVDYANGRLGGKASGTGEEGPMDAVAKRMYDAANAIDLGGKDLKAGCAIFVSEVAKSAGVIGKSIDGAKALDEYLVKQKGGERIGLGTHGELLNKAKAGDVLFFQGPGFGSARFKDGPNGQSVGYHTGVYVGGGMMRHEGSGGVRTVPVRSVMQGNQTGMWSVRLGDAALGGIPNSPAKGGLDFLRDPKESASDKKKLAADPYRAKADAANAQAQEAEKQLEHLMARYKLGEKVDRQKMVDTAQAQINAMKRRDDQLVQVAKITGLNADGVQLNAAQLAGMPGNQQKKRRETMQAAIDQIDETVLQTRNKHLQAINESLQLEKKSIESKQKELEAQLGMTVGVENQHKIRAQVLDLEKKTLEKDYQIEKNKVLQIKDPAERKKAMVALDDEFSSKRRVLGLTGKKVERDKILGLLDEREKVYQSGGYADVSDSQKAQREAFPLLQKIATSRFLESMGLGPSMSQAETLEAQNKLKGIQFGMTKRGSERNLSMLELRSSLSSDPEAGYINLRTQQRARDKYLQKYDPDSLQQWRVEAREAERKADIERQTFRFDRELSRVGFGTGGTIENARKAYESAMARARTQEDRNRISGAYRSSLGEMVNGTFMNTGSLSGVNGAMRSTLGEYNHIMAGAKEQGDLQTYMQTGQAAQGLVGDMAKSAYDRIRFLPREQRAGAASAINDLIQSIPEWKELPKDLREGLQKSLKDSLSDARMEWDERYRGRIEARRSFDRGAEGSIEGVGSSLIGNVLKGSGDKNKEAIKQFWDSILGQGADSLAHVAWTNVLKPEFTRMFDALKGQFKGIWEAGQVSWGQMISMSVSAMYLAGQQGKKGKKGATWGGALGAIAGSFIPGVGTLAGASIGANMGGAYSSGGGIGGAVLAGAGSYAGMQAGGKIGGTPRNTGVPDVGYGNGFDAGGGAVSVKPASSRSVTNNITINAGDNQTADHAAQRIQERTYRAIHQGT